MKGWEMRQKKMRREGEGYWGGEEERSRNDGEWTGRNG